MVPDSHMFVFSILRLFKIQTESKNNGLCKGREINSSALLFNCRRFLLPYTSITFQTKGNHNTRNYWSWNLHNLVKLQWCEILWSYWFSWSILTLHNYTFLDILFFTALQIENNKSLPVKPCWTYLWQYSCFHLHILQSWFPLHPTQSKMLL